MGVCSAVFY